MSTVFRQNASFFGALGTGLFIGIGGAIIYMKLANTVLRELVRLSNSIAELRSEVRELKQKVETSRPRRRRAFYSAQTSSADEDTDAFEDAYEGLSTTTTSEEYQDVPTEPEDQDESTEAKGGNLFEEVDKLVNGEDEDKFKAYKILLNNKTKYLADADYHWRLSKSTYQVAQIEGGNGNEQKKKELLYESNEIAGSALRLNDNLSSAHKWFSITLGSIGDYEGTQQKIKNGYVFKEHIERAIQLSPKDPSNHHLLGRWCYGVYMLSWIERKAAAALFATPPSSTAEEALKHFLQAESLNPGVWKENMLYVGKCYIEMRDYPEATQWLEKAIKLPVISQDDKTSQTEIESLLAKYRA